MEELKPCPFPVCGSDDVVLYAVDSLKGDGSLGLSGKCRKCHSRGPTRDTPEEAAVAWNQREKS
jgi:Lar family restriction alleviation protein